MPVTLPPLPTPAEVLARLSVVFPEGDPREEHCTKQAASVTVFTMLYVGAVEGSGVQFQPKMGYRMTHEQAALVSDVARRAYKGAPSVGGARWYQDNSREAIRDEALRQGLVPNGAVKLDQTVATSANRPRYVLEPDFAALFNPALSRNELAAAAEQWRITHLSRAALTRIAIVHSGAASNTSAVQVQLPNGEALNMAAGPSSVIAKAVIEVFARHRLTTPALLWLSEGRKKVLRHYGELAQSVGLAIDPAKRLPDMILADLGTDPVRIVFVEVVATDGAITDLRRAELEEIASGYDPSQLLFVTAYLDRKSKGFKKTYAALAWGSFAWFASEPEHLAQFHEGGETKLTELAHTD